MFRITFRIISRIVFCEKKRVVAGKVPSSGFLAANGLKMAPCGVLRHQKNAFSPAVRHLPPTTYKKCESFRASAAKPQVAHEASHEASHQVARRSRAGFHPRLRPRSHAIRTRRWRTRQGSATASASCPRTFSPDRILQPSQALRVLFRKQHNSQQHLQRGVA